MSQGTPSEAEKYDVCLSFAGEQREYVERVAEALKPVNVRVSYDKYEAADFGDTDFYQHLVDVYRGKLCVVFLSAAYAEKLWKSGELRNAQARAFNENRESLLAACLDDTEIPRAANSVERIDVRKKSGQKKLVDVIVKKLTGKKLCKDCSKLIQLNARRCECGHYQDWRRNIPISASILDVLKGLIAVLTPLVLGTFYVYECHAPSKTSFTVTESDRRAVLYVDVSNQRRNKSYLRKYVLEFGDLPIESRVLRPVSSDVGVIASGIPQGNVRIGFVVPGLRTKKKPGSQERYTKSEIKALMRENPQVILRIEIQESGDPPTGPFHTKDYPFLVNVIRDVVLNKIPDEVPQ